MYRDVNRIPNKVICIDKKIKNILEEQEYEFIWNNFSRLYHEVKDSKNKYKYNNLIDMDYRELGDLLESTLYPESYININVSDDNGFTRMSKKKFKEEFPYLYKFTYGAMGKCAILTTHILGIGSFTDLRMIGQQYTSTTRSIKAIAIRNRNRSPFKYENKNYFY